MNRLSLLQGNICTIHLPVTFVSSLLYSKFVLFELRSGCKKKAVPPEEHCVKVGYCRKKSEFWQEHKAPSDNLESRFVLNKVKTLHWVTPIHVLHSTSETRG